MYRVENGGISKMEEARYADIGIWERRDIQEWIAKNPDILGEDEDALLVLTTELPVNDDNRIGIRLDILALDRTGTLVVVELKRDEGRGDVEWQAIKYAARCSAYTPEKLVDLLAKKTGSHEAAMRQIVAHVQGDAKEAITIDDVADVLERDSTNSKIAVRIVLVARSFHPDVAAASLWLLEGGINISCIRLKPYRHSEAGLFLVPEKIIPLPVTADYTAHGTFLTSSIDAVRPKRQGRQIHDSSVPSMSDVDIESRLLGTLSGKTDLIARLKAFLELLVDTESAIDRETVKERLHHEKGVGDDVGHAGRYLSNISQFLTKPDSGHLRILVKWEGEDRPGAPKTNFRLNPDYRELVKRSLTHLEASTTER